jgi:hypothetical protein
MKTYRILCYTSEFSEFKHHANNPIAELSTNEQDQFALIMAVSLDGGIGFNRTPYGDAAINALVSKCFWVEPHKMTIKPPVRKHSEHMPCLMFRAKNDDFKRLLEDHEKYDRNLRKHQVLIRHRHAESPNPAILSSILQSAHLRICGKELYDALQETCHYVTVRDRTGEHGSGAFIVFSRNLDFFFKEFDAAVEGYAEIDFVDSPRKLIHW